MPELPEVEYAARNLRRWLRGRRVERFLAGSRVARGLKAPGRLVGRRVVAVDRRGKWLRLRFEGDLALFAHLGMTGKWVRRRPDEETGRHERARLDAGGRSARYLDPRMFGRIVLAPLAEPPDGYAELGPDPLVDGLEPGDLGRALEGTRRSIKEALMDQRRLAGLGNIQAAEALFRARIHPATPAPEVAADRARLRRLQRGILSSIDHTLASQEGPEITYVEESGPNPFLVYAREGEPCPRCRTPLRRLTQGGRSTFFCPRCQPG